MTQFSNIQECIKIRIDREWYQITFHSPWIGDDERLQAATEELNREAPFEKKLEYLFKLFGPGAWQFNVYKIKETLEPLS